MLILIFQKHYLDKPLMYRRRKTLKTPELRASMEDPEIFPAIDIEMSSRQFFRLGLPAQGATVIVCCSSQKSTHDP